MLDGWTLDGWMLDGWLLDGWLLDGWLLDGWLLDGLGASSPSIVQHKRQRNERVFCCV